MEQLIRNTYYYVKPLIPRRLQIGLRRRIVLRQRAKCSDIWPIDRKASSLPEKWPGWPYGNRFALVLTHDVETSIGQGKCIHLASLEETLGFRSSFNFVAESYKVSPELLDWLRNHGFEIGVHGLHHRGDLFKSRKSFLKEAVRINLVLEKWGAIGFRAPGMYHNLAWIQDLNIAYDASTFDTDPFEPQSDGVRTIFPFWVSGKSGRNGIIELPYTLPQDFTLFVLMKEKGIQIWKEKLHWIAEHGGMVLLITHPDYMNFDYGKRKAMEYQATWYTQFLEYIRDRYDGQYWNALPEDMARFWSTNVAKVLKQIDKK